MSRAEVRHRTAVEIRRRLGWLPWMAAAADRDDPWVERFAADSTLRAGLGPALSRQLATHLYGPEWSPARLAASLRAAGAAERIIAEAVELRAHRVRLLGYGVRELGLRIDWHRDPITGFRWPAQHWGRIDRGLGDGKVIWELNRHQHWLALGRAYWLTGDRRYRDHVVAQLYSWLDANPPLAGVNRGACRVSGNVHSHVSSRSAGSIASIQWIPMPVGFCSIHPASCSATSSAYAVSPVSAAAAARTRKC